MTTAILARVSTAEQADPKKASLEDQLIAGREMAAANGWEVVAEITEPGVSGGSKLADRPGLQELLGLAQRGEISHVIWYKSDRASRSARVALDIYGDLEDLGVKVHASREDIEADTPGGKLFRTIMAGVAEHEKETTAERSLAGRLNRAGGGQYPGGLIPFGYILNEGETAFLENPEGTEPATVRRVFELRIAGLSMPQIAAKLNAEGHQNRERAVRLKGAKVSVRKVSAWKTTRISQMIRLPLYKGDPLTMAIRLDPTDDSDDASTVAVSIPCDAIVTPKVWEEANEKRVGLVPTNAGNPQNEYVLGGRLLHDHLDGNRPTMSGATRSNTWTPKTGPNSGQSVTTYARQYHCKEGRTLEGDKAPRCPGFGVVQSKTTTRVPADRIEALVGIWMLDTIGDPAKLQAYAAEADRRLIALTSDVSLADLEDAKSKALRRRLAVLDEYREGYYGDLDSDDAKRARDVRISKYDDEISAITAEIERATDVGQERDRLALTVAELLAVKVDGSGEDVEQPQTERGSAQWVDEIRNACLHALTPGKRGATPDLPPSVVSELHRLADDLGVSVILSANPGGGDGPRLLDTEGETIAALGARIGAENPARWPHVTIGFDPSLSRRVVSQPAYRAQQDTPPSFATARIWLRLDWSGKATVIEIPEATRREAMTG